MTGRILIVERDRERLATIAEAARNDGIVVENSDSGSASSERWRLRY
ncbi:MAG TPA: hypothetical protein VFN10_14045 [Thermoanaerobaculia bacterium]|nr:hypothetical protein [Thermoanaerobaculia bacterium]